MRAPQHFIVRAAAAALIATCAHAQTVQSYIVRPGGNVGLGSYPPSVQAVDLAAGGVARGAPVVGNWIPEGAIRDAFVRGQEIWAVDDGGLVRSRRSDFTLISETVTDVRMRALAPMPGGGAVCFGRELANPSSAVAVEVDANGVEVQRFFGAPDVLRAARVGSSLIAVAEDHVLALDATYQSQGIFSPSAEALVSVAGVGFFPQSVSVQFGEVVIVTIGGIVRTDLNGVVLGYGGNTTGPFESSAAPTDAGDLVVLTSSGLQIFDRLTSQASNSVALVDFGPGVPFLTNEVPSLNPSSTRICVPLPNSTGRRAALSILASDDVARERLSVFVRGLPAGATTQLVYGDTVGSLPFGNGTLCVDPDSGGLVRSTVAAASANGTLESRFTFNAPAAGGEFLAGTTWVLQAAYRDPGFAQGFAATDAVTITFQP